VPVVYDSVILIDALNGDDAARIRLDEDDKPIISTVTRTEVLTGGNDSKQVTQIIALIDGCENIPVTSDIADLAADLCKKYKLKTADAIIYATARSLGVSLVTRDRAFPDEADVMWI
jgi:predicted nucleic acid-binding protein